ncbi:unnamed protein product [Ixodes pacificus]
MNPKLASKSKGPFTHTRSERPLRLGTKQNGWNDELPRQRSAKRPCRLQRKELSRIKCFATKRSDDHDRPITSRGELGRARCKPVVVSAIC